MLGTSVTEYFGFTGGALIPTLATVLSMMAGTLFGVWLGELISEYGIRGQGLSLIIFSGIVAKIPSHMVSLLSDSTYWWLIFIVVALLVVTIFAVVHVQQGRRYVPVMFPRSAGRQPDVYACQEQRALDGQYGRHDPDHLCAIYFDLPHDFGEFLQFCQGGMVAEFCGMD